jgi:PncC family amidohydrolase
MKNKIEELVTIVGHTLKENKLTLVTAESCTGGGLAYFITLNHQTSSLLERGYVTYSNQSKENLLEVLPSTLQTAGAVSKEIAIEMAKGALKNSNAQVAISITGIAGPDMNKNNKNMKGVAWVCCCSSILKAIMVKQYKLSGSRDKFCEDIILDALHQLIVYVKKIP